VVLTRVPRGALATGARRDPAGSLTAERQTAISTRRKTSWLISVSGWWISVWENSGTEFLTPHPAEPDTAGQRPHRRRVGTCRVRCRGYGRTPTPWSTPPAPPRPPCRAPAPDATSPCCPPASPAGRSARDPRAPRHPAPAGPCTARHPAGLLAPPGTRRSLHQPLHAHSARPGTAASCGSHPAHL